MSSDDPDEPDATRSAAIAAAILGVAFTITALVLYGGRTAVSVAMGALIAIANLLTLRAIIRALVRGEEDGETAPSASLAWGVFAILKILVLFGGIWFLLRRGFVDGLPLVVGYGVLPLGIASSALWSSRSRRS